MQPMRNQMDLGLDCSPGPARPSSRSLVLIWASSQKDMPGTSQGEQVETQNKTSELDQLGPHQLANLHMEEQLYSSSTRVLLSKSLFLGSVSQLVGCGPPLGLDCSSPVMATSRLVPSNSNFFSPNSHLRVRCWKSPIV